MRCKQTMRGFTLVELLVVIAIIGVLMAMTMPAMMASREVGRRNICRANMSQLLLALASYENSFESLPPGVVNPDGPIRNEPQGLHQGWLIPILPELDEQNAYAHIKLNESVYAPANEEVHNYWPRVLVCPSEPNDLRGASNYAGCQNDVEAPIAEDNHGVLFLNSHVRREDVPDGMAHTLFISEKLAEVGDLGWLSGTRATLRNTGLSPNDTPSHGAAPQTAEGAAAEDDKVVHEKPDEALYVGGYSSAHPGGVHAGFGDGRVDFITDGVDLKVWHQMGNRADGTLPASPDPAK